MIDTIFVMIVCAFVGFLLAALLDTPGKNKDN